jgi:hypothetical protein
MCDGSEVHWVSAWQAASVRQQPLGWCPPALEHLRRRRRPPQVHYRPSLTPGAARMLGPVRFSQQLSPAFGEQALLHAQLSCPLLSLLCNCQLIVVAHAARFHYAVLRPPPPLCCCRLPHASLE